MLIIWGADQSIGMQSSVQQVSIFVVAVVVGALAIYCGFIELSRGAHEREREKERNVSIRCKQDPHLRARKSSINCSRTQQRGANAAALTHSRWASKERVHKRLNKRDRALAYTNNTSDKLTSVMNAELLNGSGLPAAAVVLVRLVFESQSLLLLLLSLSPATTEAKSATRV